MSTVKEEVEQLTDREHVLRRPGMYVGEVVNAERTFWVVGEDGRMHERTAQVNMGVYKLFDEVIMNAADHAKKGKGVKNIKVNLDPEKGCLTVENDGEGIDIRQHSTLKKYIPELIFGHLRTGTNFGTSDACVGGQNGYGVKLVGIWSKRMSVDLVGPNEGELQSYKQDFLDNLTVIRPPVVKTAKSKKTKTVVSFEPDWERFGSTFDEPMQALLKRRVFDLAAVTDKAVQVWFNDVKIPARTFSHYVDMYVGEKKAVTEAAERWEIAAALSDEYQQISFVNGLCTYKGGRHVDYIVGQIVNGVAAFIQKKKKLAEPPRSAFIKSRLIVFVNASIETPTFDSQTKDMLTTVPSKFGSKFEVSEKFISKLALETGLMDLVAEQVKAKDAANDAKTDGRKRRVITGILKLCDAQRAGTVHSKDCTLILTEGDSAKAAVLGGLTEKMREVYGVYPLRGKLPNPRDKSVSENKEICELKQILGLKTGQVYTAATVSELRYGKVMIITDQDLDGCHIKGLLVNMFDTLWPSLVRDPDIHFLCYMNTPIIKARKGTAEKLFYSEQEFKVWKEAESPKGWTIKYYKGLGTSTSKEFGEYFQDGKCSVVQFDWSEESGDCISKVFDKARSDDRKRWLTAYDPEAVESMDPKKKRIKFDHFVDEQFIEFSMYDNQRSIPSGMDGFKPSTRKILYACLKKGIDETEIKVAQLSGYVAEHTAYHHGEASLNGAIVGMAQDFVGSNNVNLLLPLGQFGSRLGGGDDSASERYIFTKLNALTRKIFPEADDAVLDYNVDDGMRVEPVFFAPILPMVLVNGSVGIGTGWSTEVPCFNPVDVIDHLTASLKGEPPAADFTPFYRGFKGTIENAPDGKYVVRGAYTAKDELNLVITELPVGVWTNNYKQFLETLVASGKVKEYVDHCTDAVVKFSVRLAAPVENVEKEFKLSVTKSTNNMHMFNPKGKLVRYANVQAVFDDFIPVRLAAYVKRKALLQRVLAEKLKKATNKVRFIQGVLCGAIEIRGLSEEAITALLQSQGLEEIDGGFGYLVSLPLISLSKEKVDKLMQEMDELAHEAKALEGTTVEAMWLSELEALKAALTKPPSAPSKKQPRP